jgi:hypothetical protein
MQITSFNIETGVWNIKRESVEINVAGAKLGPPTPCLGRSQWPCGLSRGFTVARLLGLWVRIPPGALMSVFCECCMLSGRGLCDGLITRPEESYRVWCV